MRDLNLSQILCKGSGTVQNILGIVGLSYVPTSSFSGSCQYGDSNITIIRDSALLSSSCSRIFYFSGKKRSYGIMSKMLLRVNLMISPTVPEIDGFRSLRTSLQFSFRSWFIFSPEKDFYI